MIKVLTTIVLVLGMLLGGSGITLAAAQASLPDQPLYDLKLWTETVRYSLAGDNADQKVQLLLTFAEQRMQEFMAMAFSEKALENGTMTMYFEEVEPKLAMVQSRYFGVVDNALRLATGKAKETEAIAALDAIGDTLKAHILKLDRDRTNPKNKAPNIEPVFDAAEVVLEKLGNRYSWAKGVTTGELALQQLTSALEVQTQAQKQQQVQAQVQQQQAKGQSETQGQQQQAKGQTQTGTQTQQQVKTAQPAPAKQATPQASKQSSGTAAKTSNSPFGIKSGDTLPAPGYGPGPGELKTSPYQVKCNPKTGTCTRIPYGTSTPNAQYGPGQPPETSPGGSGSGSGSPSKKP